MHLAWRITLEAPLEPKLGLPIEPSGAILNGSLVGEGVFIGWSSLSFVNSSLLEWEAEEDAMSTRKNESESAKATVIDWSSWGLFNRLIVVDALDRRMVNRRLRDSKGALEVPLSSIETARSSSFFTKKKRALTRAPASTRFGHFDGWVVLKVFCSSSSKWAGWPIGCGVFKIVKTVNLVNTLGWLRGMLSVNGKNHVIRHVLTLRIFGAVKKLRFQQNCEKVLNWLNSTNWAKLHKSHVQGSQDKITCKGHASCPRWSAFTNGWRF